jgi:hypothetical protein
MIKASASCDKKGNGDVFGFCGCDRKYPFTEGEGNGFHVLGSKNVFMCVD